jgi:DNA replication protein DnaC
MTLDDRSLDELLVRLHLANTRRVWSDLCRHAEQSGWSFRDFLCALLSQEVAHRQGTSLAKRIRDAHFPFQKTVEEFNFTYQSQLRPKLLGTYLGPDFVTQGRSAIFLGKPGRGKTHLAIAIALRAIHNGFSARFVTAAALIEELSQQSHAGHLREALADYIRPDVLVVDEVGYLTYGQDAANVLFHLVNERHLRRRAMLFTTNKPLKAWGRVLHDDDLAEALIDRILERGRLIHLDGPSVRTQHLDEPHDLK